MSCCEDKSIFLYSDVNTTIDAYKLVSVSSAVQVQKLEISNEVELIPTQHYQSNAPPTIQGRAIYQLNSSYTVYG